MPHNFNNFVNNYKSDFDYKDYSADNSYEFSNFFALFKNGKILIENKSMRDDTINLASCSKPFTTKLLTQILTDKKIDSARENFNVTSKFWMEKANREDAKASNAKASNAKASNAKAHKKNLAESNSEFADFKTVATSALKLSSNSAIESIRSKLAEYYPNPEKLQRYLESTDIAPTFEMHQGGDKFWEQPGANTGSFIEIVKSFYKLSYDLEINKEQNNYDQIIYESLKNNSKHFDCGISKPLIDNKLISDNFYILEKTGMMWPVCWGESLSSIGYPPHMVIGTLFSIFVKGKNGFDVFTGGKFKMIAIAIGNELDEDGLPYSHEKKYSKYITLTKIKYTNLFRKELLADLKKSKIVDKDVKLKISIKDRIKNILYRF